MMISRERAVVCGLAAIVGVIAIQSFSSFSCYGHTIQDFFGALEIFLMVPLLPALISLCTKNPLRAVGACLLFAPWLLFAYYTDCVCPYTGGGASMVYVVVLLWGTPCAIIGAVLTDPILRALGVSNCCIYQRIRFWTCWVFHKAGRMAFPGNRVVPSTTP